MYVAFSAAALPFAWLGLNDIVVFQSHPEMLESRDSAPVVMSVYWATRITLPALACAVLSALYFLIAGHVVLPWLYAGVRFVVRKKTATVTTDA